jgi:hypothetical protein
MQAIDCIAARGESSGGAFKLINNCRYRSADTTIMARELLASVQGLAVAGAASATPS